MEKERFTEHIVENKEQIVKVLEIDSLKDEVESLKKEMEMLSIFKKFFQNDETEAKNTINELKSKNKQFQKEIENLKEEYKQQLNENKKLQIDYATLTQENQTLKNELEKVKDTSLNKLQTLYNSLNHTTKTGLKNSLHSDDPLTLFASGILYIEPLWEYAKYLLVEQKEEDFKTLREIFYILFEHYKKVEDLEYQKVSLNEEFDSYEHIRDSKSESAGSIQTIQLKGFCRDGEVVKKTVVRVE